MELLRSIRSGPIFLFLGQAYLKMFTGRDIFLKAISRDLIGRTDKDLNYDVFLNLPDNVKFEEAILWMQEKSERISVPEQLDYIAQIPWNGVITSTVDTILPRSLENTQRTIIEVYSRQNRNISKFTSSAGLHITRLYSSIAPNSDRSIPPTDFLKLASAHDNASNLLRLYSPEVITPYGALVIDGYDPRTDWLNSEKFYPLLSTLGKNQVHFFNFPTNFEDQYFSDLAKRGILCKHTESFAEYLMLSIEKGYLDLNKVRTASYNIDLKRITIKDKIFPIPKDLYLEITEEAIILDDDILLPEKDIDEFEAQESYRQFLYQSSTKPIWEAYKRNFNICRNFEEGLLKKINDKVLGKFSLNPIILSGQSGSGKSVSLGHIAYKLKKQNNIVLFIPKRRENISYATINNFCKWAEDHQADITYIFWDGSFGEEDLDKYDQLNNFLVTRGRRVLLIGSSYVTKNLSNSGFEFDEAGIKLHQNEIDQLCTVFDKYSMRQKSIRELWTADFDDNLLVALYRLLPPTRRSFRTGILKEADSVLVSLKKILKISEEELLTPIAKLLMDAKLYLANDNDKDATYHDLSKMIIYVCVPSQYGISVPMSLLLRTLKYNYDADIFKTIDNIDFFNIEITTDGRFEISARNSLEAEIVVGSKLATQDERIDVVLDLIRNISGSYDYLSSRTELDFLIDLLKSVGPNGKNKNEFFLSYINIAQEIANLRVKENIYDARTILQEAFYLREHAKTLPNDKMFEKESFLIDAQDILLETISELRDDDYKKVQKGNLYIELAANLGAQLKICLKNNQDYKNIKSLYNQLDNSLTNAKRCAPNSFYPIDIWAWTSEDLLTSQISDDFKGDVAAKILSVFDIAPFDNPEIVDTKRYNEKRQGIAKALGNKEMENESFKKLINMGSASGIYLNAHSMLKGIDLNKPVNKKSKNHHADQHMLERAIDYMESFNLTWQDHKCLYLLLKLYWLLWIGKPIFYEEKQILPLKDDNWKKIFEITDSILDTMTAPTAWVTYIKGISLFHLKRYKDCFALFDELRNSYEGGKRRIIISYVASNEDNTAKTFRGSFLRISKGKAIFSINDLRRDIPYFNRDFITSNPPINRVYEKIELGFNYLGIQVSKV